MSATFFYRAAALVFVVTALGHTYAVLSPPPTSTEARAAYNSMKNVRFHLGGRERSYGDIYRGLGLSLTASMLFWAFLSWHLGNLTRSAPDAIGTLGWAFFIVQLAGVVLSFLYFHLPAMVLSGLATVIVGSAALLALSQK